jgi:hypothetical protein
MMNQRHLQRFLWRAELGRPNPRDVFRKRLYWLVVSLIVLNLIVPVIASTIRVAIR